jgi:hypothetical protein
MPKKPHAFSKTGGYPPDAATGAPARRGSSARIRRGRLSKVTAPGARLNRDRSLAFEGERVRGYKPVKIHPDSVELLTPEAASLTLSKP